jgi:hypothetical protein
LAAWPQKECKNRKIILKCKLIFKSILFFYMLAFFVGYLVYAVV